MSRKNVEDIYPLAPMQQGMLFHTLVASQPGAYFVQHGSTLVGPLDVPAFVKAWQEVVNRHAILRSAFVWERREEPLQVVRQRATLPVEQHDLRGLSPAEQAARVDELAAADRRRGFDLARAPLIRLVLIRLAEEAYRLFVSSHHILLDGWSTQVVFKEAYALYDAYSQNKAPLLDRPRPFGEFVGWLQKQDRAASSAFWRRKLGSFTAPTPFGVERAAPLEAGFDAGRGSAFAVPFTQARLELAEPESAALAAFARQQQVTLSTLLQGAWALLLSRYSGEADVVFGSTVSGRSAPVPGIERMVGLFINTLPVRVEVDAGAPALSWLKELQEQQAESRDHEHSSLVEAQGASGVPRGTPLFESLVVFENYPVEEAALAGMRGIEVREMRTVERTDYALTLVASFRGTLLLRLTFDRKRFDDVAVQRLLGHLRALLNSMAREPATPLGDLPMLSGEEQSQLLVEWNQTRAEYPRDASIQSLFEAQVAEAPDATAVVFGEATLSYRELDQRANRLAHRLRALGVAPEEPVALYAKRSLEMVIATLAILKAGGAYLPVDPEYPARRIAWMLDDAGARVIVCAGRTPDLALFGERQVVDLGRADLGLEAESAESPPSPTGGGSLAYLMYTSGSTGTPKGVCVVHRGVTRLVKNTNFAPFDRDEVFLQLASIAFDAATLEIWGPLLNGGRLVVAPAEAPSLAGLGALIAGHGVTTLWLTSGLFNAMIDASPEGLRPLRRVLTGGEALSVPHVQRALAELPGVQIINGYGPTEGTTFSTCHPITPADTVASIPIGRPIANTTVRILDPRMHPVPIGVPGELFIGGDGLARGYLSRPELTAERFVADPFVPGERLYRTGDLSRWLPDGTIGFVGRRDHQVKIRGFRIELGEIEAALAQQPEVGEVVVLAREAVDSGSGDRRVVAYVVPAAGESPSTATLRASLADKLPGYMIPSAFVLLERMPLNTNGKIDRGALPAPDAGAAADRPRIAPRGPVEEALAGIFADVLELAPSEVAAHDGFFELGGHSILATLAISRIRGALGVDLPLRALFESPTVAELAAAIEAATSGTTSAVPPLVKASGDAAPALSFAQERLWFLAQLTPDDPSYVIPLLTRIEGALDPRALERALRELVRRHEVLRTTFTSAGGLPTPELHPSMPLDLEITRWSDLAREARESEARAAITAEARRPFDLATGPLLRARLFAIDDREHLLLITLHHIASDAWSLGVMNAELTALYAAFVADKPSPLPELAIQYGDYAAWQRAWLAGEVFERQLAYWRDRLGGASRVLDLPTDRRRPGAPSHIGGRHLFRISPATTRALKDLCRREGVTLFMALLAAFDALLYRYTGQSDLSVGTPIANRARGEVEGLVGLFLNTLVIRAEIDETLTARQLLQQVKAACLGAYAHQDVPFERLVQELDPARDLGRTPLFQASFTVQPVAEPMCLPGLELRRESVTGTTAKFDLSLVMQEGASDLGAMIEYAAELFDPETVERMAQHLERLIEAIARSPDKTLRELPLLGDDERRAILTGWNDTAAPLPDACIHELFEAQAAATPDALAVAAGSVRLTYGELDRRANQLARHLSSRGVGPDTLVGVCVERSPETLIGLLGVLKAGAAYVALDPAHPKDRLAFAIADTGMRALLTQDRLASRVGETGALLIRLDADWPEIARESEARIAIESEPEQLAYVIYTSGSTGTPKGVELRHAGLVNLALWHRRTYGVVPADRATHLAAPGFDAAVWEIWPYLISGASLFIPDEETRGSPPRLAAWIATQGITLSFLPTPLAEAVLADPWPAGGSLRAMLTGGDRLQRRPSADLPFKLVNHYGPTEYTVVTTFAEVAPEGEGAPPIGRPIDNTRVYVLDANREPVPVGVPGELYIGGVGLARGYLARPELTAERFVQSPFASGERLYRTGDRVRFRRTGDLEFLRRIDDQVKVRGFRIELGEIESVLAGHPSVRECAVLAIEPSGDRRLVAYVAGEGVSPPDLRAFLKEKLPDYMVPSAFVALDRLPLTANGKIDRKALPAPDPSASLATAFVAPRGPIEEAVASIFADVLRVAEVGAHAGFFELGGHSLLATQAIARIRAALGVDLPLLALFEAPTVAELAARVGAALASGDRAEAPPLLRAPRDSVAPLPLSFGQERLWFLDQLDPGDLSYLVPSALRLEGQLDIAALERALDTIVQRHEVLRTTFTTTLGRPVPVIHEAITAGLTITRRADLSPELRAAALSEVMAADAARPFDLATGPLLRAHLFELAEGEHVLLLTMHHIVSDAWTQGILNGELATLYAAFAAGKPSPLPELPIQYADYAAWQRGWLTGEVLDRQVAYWRERLGPAQHALDLPTDRPRPPVPSHRGARRAFELPGELASALAELSRREGATLFMTLLAAFDVLLHRYTGQTDVVVGTPIANRTRAETEGLIGFFVNTLVIRAELAPELSFRALLARVRESCLGAYAHQDTPFERLVHSLASDRDLSRTPLFQVMFTLQNAPTVAIELPGLRVTGERAASATSKFDLTLAMADRPGSLAGSLEYSTDLFDAATIDRMVGHLQTLLEGIVRDPAARLRDLPILPASERQTLLEEWNDPSASFRRDACVHTLVEAQVDRTPDALAVTFEGRSLTYRELDERANRLAHHLRGLGVGAETLVGLCVQRSIEMLVGILGILKAGGAYLPLDPEYPRDRLAFMVEDSNLPVLLTEEQYADTLPAPGARVVRLDSDWETIARSPATRPANIARPDGLAYVIYTSGSTGKPKGALICHSNVARLFDATQPWYRFDATDVWTMFHSYAFDFSVWEIWGALLYGGRVVIVPYWVSRAPDAFYKLLRAERVTVLNQTPSAFRQLIRAEESVAEAERALALRYVIFGGEALDLNDLRPWWDRHGDTTPQLVNMYGITETTVHVTYRPVGIADLARPWSSVIGRPIPDLQVYILDPAMQPVPIGVPGEMYVGGAGVSRGYLSRPELTAARFLPNPFGDAADRDAAIAPGNRLYRTGDVARYLPSGDIEYLGRIDHQVKIRGFRIELGEIEAMLGQHPGVHEVVVLARGDSPGEKRLVGYLVARAGVTLTVAEIRAYLKEKLPEYMVPAIYVTLPALPLTASGKVDRRALPAPEEGERPELGGDFVAPRSTAEEAFAQIWSEVLRLDKKIGVNDNFFEIGGDSILSIQIVARAQQAGLRITPRQIFQHPTIAELAEVAGSVAVVAAEQGPVTGPVELTPIARWWLEQQVAEPNHWNQAFFLQMREPLDPAALDRAVIHLLVHHDALRVRLTRGEGGWQQSLAAPGGPSPVRRIDLHDVSDTDLPGVLEKAAADAQTSLDLESGPALRVVLFDCGAERPNRLFLVIHHLAVDGVSWRVIFEDLWALYEQARQGETFTLPPKTTSLARWAERLSEHARSVEVSNEIAYWLDPRRARVPRIPVDAPLGDNTEASVSTVRASLDEIETRQLLREVPEAYQTQINDVLLAAFAQAFGQWTGHDGGDPQTPGPAGSPGALVDLEGHGREDLFEDVDLSRTVGWFTTVYPVLLDTDPSEAPGALLKSVKEQLRAIPTRGLGYGLLRYLREGDPVSERLRALPEAEVSFNYLGQLDQALPEASVFSFAGLSSGPPHSPRALRRYLVDVTAAISGGRLEIRLIYSENRHRKGTIEALSERFLGALRALIAHCLSPDAGGYTPSDFQEEGLSQDVIDMLAGMDGDLDPEQI